jgi:alpha-tubulin suppressor-like RCC1 family protein
MAAVVSAGTAVPAVAATSGPGVFGSGSNASGELGNGTTTDSYSPVPATGLPGPARQVAAAYFTSAALLADGTVWAWGADDSGVLGNGVTGGTVTTPRQVPGLSGVTQITLGVGDAYALRSDGTVWAWGFNQSGQLGIGNTLNIYQPVRVSGLTGITQVSAGTGYVLARRSDGTVWAWGANGSGQLGDGTATTRLVPERVPGLSGITQVAAAFSSFAVRSDGTLFGWGDNSEGELGRGTTGGFSLTPAAVPGLTGVTQVATNGETTLALAGSARTVWAWGMNGCGQFGDGTTVSRTSPGPTALAGVAQVTIGISGGAAAVRPDGTLLTWGCNGFGQLGDGVAHQFEVPPTPVRSLAGVSQIAFGGGLYGGYSLAVGSQAFATVPSLAGLTTTAAGQRLQAANLVLGTVHTVVDNTCNNIGTVISQSPAAGTVLIGGSAVSITIGQRPSHPCP